MRILWKGSIGFGLVNIPVRLYSATEDSALSFHTLDKTNKARIRYKKVNEITGKEVKQGDLIKAFTVGKESVIVEEADFEKAIPGKKDHIDITQFVAEKEIDSMFYEMPYYLEPEKSGVKAYALLRDALKKEGSGALGTFVFHNREWVCLIKPSGNALVMNRLRFAEEIKPVNELNLPDVKASAAELKMASSLIQQLTKPFKPDAFTDEYSEKLRKIIAAKSKGKKTAYKPMQVVHTTKSEDLMEKLKASLKPAKKAS